MPDLLERLAAANPVTERTHPPIDDVWDKLGTAAPRAAASRPRRRGRAARGGLLLAASLTPVVVVVALLLTASGSAPRPHRVTPMTHGRAATTLDPVLERAAAGALRGRSGTVVVLDPHSGAIRALLTDHHRLNLAGAVASGARRYPAGATADLVIAVAALDGGYLRPAALGTAMTESLTPVWSGLARRIGSTALAPTARRLGLGTARTLTPAGGPSVAVEPLQVAQILAAIANGGSVAEPRLTGPTGPSRRVMSPATARALTAMLRAVVKIGTGTEAQIHGVEVAGKTATIRGAAGTTTNWFVGFAPAGHPRYVVAVVLSGSTKDFGGTIAAPAAAAILRAALRGR